MAGTDYVVNPLDATSPLDTNVARKGAAEFRALKASVNARIAAIAPPAINEITVRQTVLGGPITAAGIPSMLAIGAGLNVDLKATAVAVTMAFAGGFNVLGATDYVEQYVADVASYWPLLPVSNTSYLNSLRTGAGVVATGQTLAPPQYGDTYDQTKQSVLQFGGAAGAIVFLDDYGNTWTRQGGAKVQTNYFKFGTGALGGGGATNALDGATDYIKTTNISSLGSGSWAIRMWVKPLNALPGAAAQWMIFNLGIVGIQFGINNAAGTIKFYYSLSSDAATNNIAALQQGTTTPVLGTEYFVELTFDALAGVYRLYVNGIQEASTASALKICTATSGAAALGCRVDGTAGFFFQGYIDKFEFLPYCQHPAGTAYAVPIAAPSITAAGYSSDWFDTSQMLMKTPSVASAAAATNPTFVTVNKLYVGEADTSAAAVTAVRTYAYQGKYRSDDFTYTLSSATTKSHNLGIVPRVSKLFLVCITNEATPGAQVGELIDITGGITVDNTNTRSATPYHSRNSSLIPTGSSAYTNMPRAGGAAGSVTAANYKLRFIAERGW